MSVPRIAILDDYQGLALTLADWSKLQGRAEVVVLRENLGPLEAAAQALAGFDVLCLMRERQALPAALIARLPRLRCVVTTGRWNAAIDLAATEARGIVVCGTENGQGQQATAELAWGLILALARGIPAQDAAMRAGAWAGPPGRLLAGRVLGLVGFGAVAGILAGYARAFGMQVLTTSRSKRPDDLPAHVTNVPLERLLQQAEVISLHTRLTDETRGIIGTAELAAMQPGALLVNTARGPLIDEAALLNALRSDRLGGVALDVWDQEPLPADHPLRQAGPRVILSPHMGYVTRETMAAFHAASRDAVLAWLDGRPIGRLTSAG